MLKSCFSCVLTAFLFFLSFKTGSGNLDEKHSISGQSPLHVAAAEGRVDIAKVLSVASSRFHLIATLTRHDQPIHKQPSIGADTTQSRHQSERHVGIHSSSRRFAQQSLPHESVPDKEGREDKHLA